MADGRSISRRVSELLAANPRAASKRQRSSITFALCRDAAKTLTRVAIRKT